MKRLEGLIAVGGGSYLIFRSIISGAWGGSYYLTISFWFRLNVDEVLCFVSIVLFTGIILGVEFFGKGGEITANVFWIFLFTLTSLKWTTLALSDFFLGGGYNCFYTPNFIKCSVLAYFCYELGIFLFSPIKKREIFYYFARFFFLLFDLDLVFFLPLSDNTFSLRYIGVS